MKLRKESYGYAHWCPACEETHIIPNGHKFDGNMEVPTFSPSIKHSGKQTVKVDGKWTVAWMLGSDGRAIDYVCHYSLIAGQLGYYSDSTHASAGKSIPLPELPD